MKRSLLKRKLKKQNPNKPVWIIEGYWDYSDEKTYTDAKDYLVKIPFLRIPLETDYWAALREAQYIFSAGSSNFVLYRIYKGTMSEIGEE